MSEELTRQVEELNAKVEQLKQMLHMQKANLDEILSRKTAYAPHEQWDEKSTNIGSIKGTISDWPHKH